MMALTELLEGKTTFDFGIMAKMGLPPGPWTGEPDKVVWVDETSELDCMAKRNHHGVWCGYVGVPAGHPWHGVDYDDVQVDGLDVSVHGGLSFAGPCQPDNGQGENRICHTPAPGRPDDVWWLGFDCGHAWDTMPFMVKQELNLPDFPLLSGLVLDKTTGQLVPVPHDAGTPEFMRTTYKPLAYVLDEILALAYQALAEQMVALGHVAPAVTAERYAELAQPATEPGG